MQFITKATNLQAGDLFTDVYGKTYRATDVSVTREAGVYVSVEGQGYPEFYTEEKGVTVLERKAAPATDRPYVVLTRKYDIKGNCYKGRRTFKTRAAQERFMRTTEAAITFYN